VEPEAFPAACVSVSFCYRRSDFWLLVWCLRRALFRLSSPFNPVRVVGTIPLRFRPLPLSGGSTGATRLIDLVRATFLCFYYCSVAV